jgi:outer membrane biogenesis lipoprotein LolB
MTLPDFRLIRLLPLASLVLTACTLNAPKGRARVRMPLSGVNISKTSAN